MAITFNHNDKLYVSGSNVGIGKADPSAPLHINGGSTNQVVKIQATTAPYVRFKEGGTDVGFIQFGTDTYISNQKAGTLNFRTNNTDKMTILSDGNVGVGTTSPGYKLEVAGEAQLGYINFEYNSNYAGIRWKDSAYNFQWKLGNDGPNGNWLYLYDYGMSASAFTFKQNGDMLFTPGGNVGIGTTSPIDKLHVEGVIQSKKQLLPSTSGTAGWYKIGTLEDFVQGGSTAVIKIAGHQGYNATNSQDYLIKLFIKTSNGNAGGPNGQGFNSWYERTGGNSATIEFKWDNSATNDYDLYMYIPTHSLRSWYSVKKGTGTWEHAGTSATDPGANSASVLKATSLFNILDANVGIGTTSPAYRLDVAGTSRSDLHIFRSNQSAPTADAFIFRPADNTVALGTANAERVRIDSSGNVGIGTTSPTAKLNVVHTASVSVPALQIASSASLASNDIVRFQINGLTNGFRMFQDASSVLNYTFQDGNVGVGTTSPTTKLYVDGGESTFNRGNSAGTIARFRGSNAEKAVIGTVDSWFASNVGIGTTSNSAEETNNGVPKLQVTTATAVLGEFPLAARFTTASDAGDNSGVSVLINSGNDRGLMISAGRAESNRSRATLNLVQYDGNELVDGITLYQPNTASSGNTTGTNVGIGTTSPGAKLDVNSGISSSSTDVIKLTQATSGANKAAASFGLSIQNSGEATNAADLWFTTASGGSLSERMRITSAGNVGIGTTSPGRPLTVNSDSAHKAIRILENDSGNESWDIGVDVDGHLNFFNSADTSPSVTFLDNGNVGIGTSPVQTLEIHDSDASGYTHFGIKGTGHKYVIGVGNDSVADVNDKLYFYDNDNSAFRLALDTSGNVGIGTTSPGAKLDIHTATNTNGLLIREDSDDSITHNFYIDSSDNGVGVLYANGQSAKIQLNTAGNSYFNGGNVGIGTTSPSEKLHLSESTSNSYATFRLQGSNRGGIIDMYQGAYPVSRYLTDQSGNISIYTSGAFGSTTLTEKVSITTAGNVGIGTTSPGEKLQVNSGNIKIEAGATSSIRGLIIAHTGQTGNQTLLVQNSTNSFGHLYTTERALRIEAGADGGTGANETLDFWVNGSERMMIDTTGNVGIGLTSPSYKLDVYTAAGVDQVARFQSPDDGAFIQIRDDDTLGQVTVKDGVMAMGLNSNYPANTMLNILNSGNVGIGTTSPGDKLQVAGNIIAQDYLYVGDGVQHWGDGGTGMNFPSNDNIDLLTSGTPRVRIDSAGNVGIGTTSPDTKFNVTDGGTQVAISNTYLAHLQSASNCGLAITAGASSNNYIAFGDSDNYDEGIINYNNSTRSFAFRTADGALDDLVIDSAGNVGIGTDSPLGKLQVNEYTVALQGNQNIHGELSVFANSGNESLFLGVRNAAYPNRGWAFNPVVSGVNSDLQIKEHGSTGVRMTLKSGGNVGIGTTSPTHKLHVNGNMRLTGALRDSNNATGSAGQVLSSTGSATDWVSLPASSTVYTPKVYNLNNSTNINSQGQKLVPDFGTLEIEGNTTVEQVSGSDTDFQVADEGVGIYEVTYAVFYKNTSNQRTPLGTYLTLNGTAVNGSLMVNYLRADVTGGGNWSSCTNTFYVNVTDASHPMALCVRRADSSTAPSGISMVEPAGMAVKSTISFRRIS